MGRLFNEWEHRKVRKKDRNRRLKCYFFPAVSP